MKDKSKAFNYVWDELYKIHKYVLLEYDMEQFEFLGVFEWYKLNHFKNASSGGDDLEDGEEWKKQKVKD